MGAWLKRRPWRTGFLMASTELLAALAFNVFVLEDVGATAGVGVILVPVWALYYGALAGVGVLIGRFVGAGDATPPQRRPNSSA